MTANEIPENPTGKRTLAGTAHATKMEILPRFRVILEIADFSGGRELRYLCEKRYAVHFWPQI